MCGVGQICVRLCVAYYSAEDTTLVKLDIVQHQALRLCTGAFKTTPTAALQVEMGEMPLGLRRTQLMLNYWANLQGYGQDHPTQAVLNPCWEKERRKSKSFGLIVGARASEFKLDQLYVCERV